MPTADRTTIRAAIDELVNKLTVNLTADPPTASKPLRGVVVGDVGDDAHARPFLAVRLIQATPLGATSDDKVMEVSMRMRLVADIVATDPHGELLDRVGAVDDYLDSIRNSGVKEGAEGFDDRSWAFEYPTTTAGVRVAAAEAEQGFVVKVQRQQNRVPA